MKRSTLDGEKLTSAFADGYWRVKTFSEVDSTQDVIRLSQPRHGDVVTADFQSKGRGRLDRSFESVPDAGLLFSLFVEPKVEREKWGVLPLLVGMSVAQTLNDQAGSATFQTKWPNDVLAAGGKIAGILCESFNSGVIVGIGINVNTSRENLPVSTASSMYLELGVELERTEILIGILRNLKNTFASWNEGQDLISAYKSSNATLGQNVRVMLPDGEELYSQAVNVGSDGALELANGERVTVGDVVHLR